MLIVVDIFLEVIVAKVDAQARAIKAPKANFRSVHMLLYTDAGCKPFSCWVYEVVSLVPLSLFDEQGARAKKLLLFQDPRCDIFLWHNDVGQAQQTEKSGTSQQHQRQISNRNLERFGTTLDSCSYAAFFGKRRATCL